jgi:hypothetical protein
MIYNYERDNMLKKCKDFYFKKREGIYLILTIISIVGLSKIIDFFFPFYGYISQLIVNNALVIILALSVYILCQLHFIKKYTKSLIVEEFDIVSDANTLFEDSKKHSSILPNTQAVATHVHDLWRHNTDQYFPFLKDSKWIAHALEITNIEATDGGDYNFKREFYFPISRDKIISAEIFIVVDDYCTIILNRRKICENLSGFSKLHVQNIKDDILVGNNEIRFQIINVRFQDLFAPSDPAWTSAQKYLLNPYGFRYRILIKYKK